MLVITVKSAILLLWAAFFVWLVSFGQEHLARLLHPDLWWLIFAAVGILLLFVSALRRSAGAVPGMSLRWQWPALAILLVPPLFFLQVKNARFNADTFAQRTIETATGFQQSSLVAPQTEQPAGTTDIPLTKLLFNTDKYLGQPVEVVCQSFISEQLPQGTAMCYRYLMTCCAADARPLFVFITHPPDHPIENDRWIRAKGPLSLTKNGEIAVPAIAVKAVEYVAEPSFPYLF